MKQYRLLDLFCGAGGAAAGYRRAGFEVVGVDVKNQPRYPSEFIRADVLDLSIDFLKSFDMIHASPPCQAFSVATKCRPGAAGKHPDLIGPTRRMLEASGKPFCIENVPGAPLRHDIVLTGDMFGLLTYRKRIFETSFFALTPRPGPPFGPESRPGTFTIAGHTGNSSLKTRKPGINRGTKADWQRAMGIDWMGVEEMANAVPPAYSEFIGRAALHAIASGDAA